MNTVWKYELEITDEQTITAPEGIGVTHVGEQNGKLCLWAVVKTDTPLVEHEIKIRGTGHELGWNPVISSGVGHLGTAVMRDGLVWHVWGTTLMRAV